MKLTLSKVKRVMEKQSPVLSARWISKPKRIKHITGVVSSRAEVELTAPGFRTKVMMVDLNSFGMRIY